jgi:putative DNA primase/helicase
MIGLDLRSIARVLGGEVVGAQVLAPGPGHSRRDRSLSVALSATSPDGFLAHSHCGDPWRDCRDHVRERLGLDPNAWKATSENRPQLRPQAIAKPNNDVERTAAALALWNASVDPRETLAERYLAGRALDLGDDVAGATLRWHPGIGAMLALFRNIATDSPQAIVRTFFDREGRKLERRFLGPTKGAAVKLDCDAEVTTGLHVGEGVETAMAGRQLGLRPCWALGSAGAVASFPVLNGIEALTILQELDDASAKAVDACAENWHAAGREVIVNEPIGGKDLNDAIRGRA